MRFGLSCEILQDAPTLVSLAEDAEAAGWDGFFLWDTMLFSVKDAYPISDPWVVLGAIAVRTKRMRIGTMITPIPRRRPWKLARETVSVDHLSGGRLILGVGLGDEPDFSNFGEETALDVRARQLEEGVELLTGLWSGEPVNHDGRFYKAEAARFLPIPLQSPRIPIWGGGIWPNRAPFRRASRWDGAFPITVKDGAFFMTPEIIKEVAAYIRAQRQADSAYEIVANGVTDDAGTKAAELVRAYGEAGATWYLESIDHFRGSLERMRHRIREGPPRL